MPLPLKIVLLRYFLPLISFDPCLSLFSSVSSFKKNRTNMVVVALYYEMAKNAIPIKNGVH
jgi:hypothetical protein